MLERLQILGRSSGREGLRQCRKAIKEWSCALDVNHQLVIKPDELVHAAMGRLRFSKKRPIRLVWHAVQVDVSNESDESEQFAMQDSAAPFVPSFCVRGWKRRDCEGPALFDRMFDPNWHAPFEWKTEGTFVMWVLSPPVRSPLYSFFLKVQRSDADRKAIAHTIDTNSSIELMELLGAMDSVWYGRAALACVRNAIVEAADLKQRNTPKVDVATLDVWDRVCLGLMSVSEQEQLLMLARHLHPAKHREWVEQCSSARFNAHAAIMNHILSINQNS